MAAHYVGNPQRECNLMNKLTLRLAVVSQICCYAKVQNEKSTNKEFINLKVKEIHKNSIELFKKRILPAITNNVLISHKCISASRILLMDDECVIMDL